MLHIKFGFDWPSGFRGKDLCKWWTTTPTDDGQTPDHGHPISSPCEPYGSGELKICEVSHAKISDLIVYSTRIIEDHSSFADSH